MTRNHRNTGNPVRYVPRKIALSTLSLRHFRLGMFSHVAVYFSLVFWVHKLLLVASQLPEDHLLLWKISRKSVLYRARKNVVLNLGCVRGGHAAPLWVCWYFFMEYHCVASGSFVCNRAHNWLLLGFPDRYAMDVCCYPRVLLPLSGLVLPCSVLCVLFYPSWNTPHARHCITPIYC